MRAWLYARVSTTDKEQNPETQLLALRTWARERGWTVVGETADHITGDPAKRRGDPPGLRKAIDALSTREAKVLAVFSADRLVRSSTHLLDLVARIQSMGASVASYRDGSDLDTTTDGGELMTFLHGWRSRMELRILRARTVAGIARARAAGKQIGRPPDARLDATERELAQHLRATRRSWSEVAQRLGKSVAAVRRALAEKVPAKVGRHPSSWLR